MWVSHVLGQYHRIFLADEAVRKEFDKLCQSLTLMDGDPGGLVDGAYRDFCVLVQAEVERVSQPSRTSNTRRYKVAKPWWSMELASLRKSVAVAQRRWLVASYPDLYR